MSTSSDSIRRESQLHESLRIEKPKLKLERSPSKVRFELDDEAQEKTMSTVRFKKKQLTSNKFELVIFIAIIQASPMPRRKDGLRLSQLNASKLHKR